MDKTAIVGFKNGKVNVTNVKVFSQISKSTTDNC